MNSSAVTSGEPTGVVASTKALKCGSCGGSGKKFRAAFRSLDGIDYPAFESTCPCCGGRGEFLPPDEVQLRKDVLGRHGLRSKRPTGNRAYYVWRMARFHGGVDVSMPVVAGVLVHGDPFERVLDALAEKIARESCGTDVAAANRWGVILGFIASSVPGLPATAYEHGPVTIAPPLRSDGAEAV